MLVRVLNCNKTQASKYTDLILNAIREGILEHEKFRVPGIGSFSHYRRNPQKVSFNGKNYDIPHHLGISFSISPDLTRQARKIEQSTALASPVKSPVKSPIPEKSG